MRTNEERIAEMHRRAAELEKNRRERVAKVLSFSSVAASLVMIIGLSFYIPHVMGTVNISGMARVTEGMNASLFATAGVLGYMVTGILAFLLGIAVTVLCFRLKMWKDENMDLPDLKEGTGRPVWNEREDMPGQEEQA